MLSFSVKAQSEPIDRVNTNDKSWQSSIHLQSEKAMTSDDIVSLYKGWATNYEDDLVGNSYVGHISIMRKTLELWEPFTIRWKNSSGPFRVLDVGCGSGLVGQSFVSATEGKFTDRSQFHITGVDVSPAMLEQAEQKNVYDALEIVDLKTEDPLKPFKPFDAMISSGVFLAGHCGPEVIPGVVAQLKPNGMFIASIRGEMLENCHDEIRRVVAQNGCVLTEVDEIPYFDKIEAYALVIQKTNVD